MLCMRMRTAVATAVVGDEKEKKTKEERRRRRRKLCDLFAMTDDGYLCIASAALVALAGTASRSITNTVHLRQLLKLHLNSRHLQATIGE